jgi:ribosomal protein S18 acetylase RimI-like enzyme
MADAAYVLLVSPLLPTDLVGLARCMALDAEVFPYASIPVGVLAGVRTWTVRVPSMATVPSVDDDSRRVLGFVAASDRALSLYVHGLAVAPAERRRGAGRALLRACLSEGKAAGLNRAVLHVGTANRAAVALYESEGFTVRRRLRDFYREGIYAERSAYEMTLPLRPSR